MHHRSLQVEERAKPPYATIRKLYRMTRSLLSTSAPINSLPNELLQHIFVLCVRLEVCHEDSSLYLRHTLDPNTPPWSLTLVCRRWYSLTVSFPELWATFVAPHRYPSGRQVRRVRVHISRSANYALDLQLRSVNSRVWEFWPDFISETSQRCKRLDMWDAYHVDLPSTTRLFPQLEVLRCPAYLIHSNLQPLHETLPRLRSLSIQNQEPKYWQRNPKVPLPSLSIPTALTTLTLSGFEYGNILFLLHSTKSRLRSLHLHNIPHESQPKPAADPISFPYLEHLSLHRVHKVVVDALDCPRLEELTVSDHMPFNPWTSPFHLTITSANLPWSVNMPHTPLVNCIGSANKLVSLRLSVLKNSNPTSFGLQRTEELFEVLSDPTMCPRLAQFSIACLPFHPRILHQIKALIRLVRSRAPTLSYVLYVAMENPDKKGWSGLVVSDGVTAKGVLKEMEDLQALYPRLDLHVKLKPKLEDRRY